MQTRPDSKNKIKTERHEKHYHTMLMAGDQTEIVKQRGLLELRLIHR